MKPATAARVQDPTLWHAFYLQLCPLARILLLDLARFSASHSAANTGMSDLTHLLVTPQPVRSQLPQLLGPQPQRKLSVSPQARQVQ